MNYARHILFVLLFLLVGCCAAQAQDEARMQQLGSALVQLVPAVEGVVCCDPQADKLEDMELLEYATKSNPKKLAPFVNNVLKVRRQGKHAAVLVCSQDGSAALMEDASCTFKMDAPLWRANPPLPCEFTLDLKAVCR